MHLGGKLEQATQLLGEVAAVDIATIHGADALVLLKLAARAKSVAASVELMLARRVEQTNQYKGLGFRSAADLVAARTGVTGAEASKSLATARQLEELPATREKFRSGELSSSQVAEVARGASANPSAEGDLLRRAAEDSVEAVRRARHRLEKLPSLDFRRKLQHLSFRPGVPGMTDFWGSLANEDFAFVQAQVEKRGDVAFREARRAGRRGTTGSYRAAGLVDLARNCGGSGSSSKTVVNVIVEHPVLAGGDGACWIPGFGAISAEVAREWADDCFLNVLLTKGKDVTTVASANRYVPAVVRKALAIRDRVCSVRHCEMTVGLEQDHRKEMRDDGLTRADNLALLCSFHHGLKTQKKAKVVGELGDYELQVTGNGQLFPPGGS